MTPYIVHHRICGLEFRQHITDAREQSWYGERDWQDWGSSLSNIVRTGDVAFDCGANVGFMSVLLAKMGAAKVLAIEPLDENAAKIRDNVALNNLGDVVSVHQTALAHRGGRIGFHAERIWPSSQRRVAVATLDTFLPYNPTFLKIDVEGYELAVLRGGQAVLATRPRMEIEMHIDPQGAGVDMRREYGFQPREILEMLFDHGYSVYRSFTKYGGTGKFMSVAEIDSFTHAGIYCV